MNALYSEKHQAPLFLGKKDAKAPSSAHIKFAELLKTVPSGAIPPIPHNFGHGYAFGQAGWGMLGNGPDDSVFPGFGGCGDCAWAGPGHEEEESGKVSKRAVPKFSGKTIVDQYSAYSGYDAHTGNNDNGSDVQEVLSWRQTKGLYDDNGNVYKIGPTVTLTPGNLDELWAATYLFENVGVGVQFQQAQMDQFNQGLHWAYVPGSSIEGGHYIVVVGNNGLISWAERVGWETSWYTNLCDEAYAYIDPERYNRVTGLTYEHFSDADLEKYISLVTQVK